MFPQQFAVRGERRKNPLRALDVNIARFLIDGRAGSGVAQINGVAEKITVHLPPKFLAGLRIVTNHAFLQFPALAQVTHDVNLAVGHDGRGLSREIHHPQRMRRIHLVRQPGFR